MNRPQSMALFIALIQAITCFADDRYWQEPDSGGYFDETNWADGLIAGPNDTAHFDLLAEANILSEQSIEVDRLIVGNGFFDLFLLPTNGKIDLTIADESFLDPGLVVADEIGDIGSLNIGFSPVFGAFASIAQQAESIGDLSVSEGLTLSGDLTVGVLGNAGCILSGPSSCYRSILAFADGSFADMTVGLNSLDCADDLIVGNGGDAELTILQAGRITCDDAVLAQQMTSSADMLVLGKGASFETFGNLDVGLTGPASFEVRTSATATTHGEVRIGVFPMIDHVTIPESSAKVRFPDTLWTIHGNLIVGYIANAHLELGLGGRIEVDGDVIVNHPGNFAQVSDVTIQLAFNGSYQNAPALTAAGSISGDPLHINVTTNSEVQPDSGDCYRLIEAGESLGELTYTLPPVEPPFQWVVEIDEHSFNLCVTLIEDLNGDGLVDTIDLLALLAAWGPCSKGEPCPADFNVDGVVDTADLLTLLGAWTT